MILTIPIIAEILENNTTTGMLIFIRNEWDSGASVVSLYDELNELVV